MTVKQFIRKVARDNGLYVYQVEQCLYAIFDGISEVMESGDDINFIRFGHFLTTDMEGHKCVLKGEEIMTKPYTKIIFRPSAKLKSSVNNKQVEDKENEE